MFRAAMRASNTKGDEIKVDSEKVLEVIDDGRKQCPFCRRKFNPEPF
jgi:uncharacterized Zn-finger protein